MIQDQLRGRFEMMKVHKAPIPNHHEQDGHKPFNWSRGKERDEEEEDKRYHT